MTATDLLLAVVALLSLLTLWQVTRTRTAGPVARGGGFRHNGTASGVDVPLSGLDAPEAQQLSVRTAADDPSQVELVHPSIETALIRFAPHDDGGGSVIEAPPWMNSVINTLVQRAPGLLEHLRHQGGARVTSYTVTFSAEVQRKLANGSATLMQSGGRTLPTAVSTRTGQILATATVAKSPATASVAGTAMTATAVPLLPVIAVAAVAVGAVYVMKRELERTIREVEGRVLAVLDRMEDDDFGRLEAALVAARHVESLLDDGAVLPQHHRIQLAIANRDVDAIYMSRHRGVRRFEEQHERMYEEIDRRGGDRKTVLEAVERLIPDPERFRREAFLYVAALIARARVGITVAALLAVDGHAHASMERSAELADELHNEANGFLRRMRALSKLGATGKGVSVVPMAADLTEMLEAATALLPPRELIDVTIRVPVTLLDQVGSGSRP